MDNEKISENVALPGAGGTDQTIFEVLNKNIASSGDRFDESQQQQEQQQQSELQEQLESKDTSSKQGDNYQVKSEIPLQPPPHPTTTAADESSKIVIESDSAQTGNGSNSKYNEKDKLGETIKNVVSPSTSDSVDNANHILEVESHLIETLENYTVSEESDASGVQVKEVPPAKEELSKSSTIETETSPKTVIEVEPSQPKLFKSVETELRVPAQEPEVGFANRNASRSPTPSPGVNVPEKIFEKPADSHIEEIVTVAGKTENDSLTENIENKENSSVSSKEKSDTSPSVQSENEKLLIPEAGKSDIPTETSTQGEKSTEKNFLSKESEKEYSTKLKSVEVNSAEVPKEESVKNKSTEKQTPGQSDESKNVETNISQKEESLQKDSNLETSQIHKDTETKKQQNLENQNATKKKAKIFFDKKHAKDTLTELVTIAELSSKLGENPLTSKTDNTNNSDNALKEKVNIDQLNDKENDKFLQQQQEDNKKQDNTEKQDQKDINANVFDEKITNKSPQLGINGLPISSTKSEEEAKKDLLDSIPQLNENDDANSLSIKAKKEFYQSLREYLDRQKEERPPVPLQTYKWEDLRRAKQQGGYPWTHLYKRPLGPDEEPEIVLLLRKSQEFQRIPSESPKSLKKVRIHEQVLVKETERYISDLSDTENTAEEDEKSIQSETPSVSASESEGKKSKINKLRGILKRSRSKSPKPPVSSQSSPTKSDSGEQQQQHHQQQQTDVPKTSAESSKKSKCCPTIMDKLKTMADKQLKRRHIKKVPLKTDEKIILSEEQKILKLKTSPKAERSEIPHFIEKQDSDEILEILELEESPSKNRKRRGELTKEHPIPEEIIEIPSSLQQNGGEKVDVTPQPSSTPTVSEILEEELTIIAVTPPTKAPRKRKDHVYEDIEDIEDKIAEKIDEILEEAVVGALKRSLATQDESVKKDLDVRPKLEELRMGSSSEEDQDKIINRLAPISSIDSASSEEDRTKPTPLTPVTEEESELGSHDDLMNDEESEPRREIYIVQTTEVLILEEDKEPELKSLLKRESSPSSDKKVTFSHIEDEAEPHREDIELPAHVKLGESRWSKISDHEYEPIGEPVDIQSQQSKQPQQQQPPFEKEPSPIIIPSVQVSEPMEIDQIEEQKITTSEESAKELQTSEVYTEETSAEEQQREIDERYFSSATTTPRTESRTDYEIHTSQVDSSALEELPLKPESRKKGFMANAQDKSRKMQANLRSQAGKIRTKLRGTKKPLPSGSPKAKEKKRFKAPEFSKMKLPEIKRPEIPKFKTPEFKKIEFKRPEFTKFNKPDMSKFKIPEKFSSLKLTRSKSLKESTEPTTIETQSGTTPESATAVTATATPSKKKFDFTFGTYPLRKKKDKIANKVVARADDVPTSSETPPSLESATIPRGARDKGPVGSKWADKFSDVSYGDSESGKYQRYGSEVESSVERGDRESSLERRMKEDLEQRAQEEAELAALETVEQKQFAEYDEENRAIHEISKNREGEFKKRHPMVHQISDVSVESKEVGWTERDILRNKILRGTESEADAAGNYPSEEGLTGSLTNQSNQETQSTGSSGPLRQKGVLEEIDDDQFFLRKRGISQDNIEIRQYISTAIREGFDTPLNALAQLGDSQGIYPTSDIDSSGQINYGYDVPPPKPRRVKKYKYDENLDSAEISQEFDIEQKENYDDNISLPQTGSDYFKNLPPSRPLRKSKKQYSEDSQDVPENDIPYFDEEDDRLFYKKEENNNLDIPQITKTFHPSPPESYINEIQTDAPPKAPKRRKKQLRESIEKDSIVNGFGGRSISNTFLPEEEEQMEELIVYRTEHEYIIPLAQTETFTTPTPPSRSRSRSRITDDDRTSRGADSTVLDVLQDDRFFVEMRENDGYAVVRKEPPPRPPPPVRRKRSPNLLDDKFATMPHFKTEVAPERPKRNYSTIGPSRPPRRKSSASIGETPMRRRSSDITQYEELDDDERPESPRNLISGDVINKMKYRPLPPPPRPPRDNRRNKNGYGGDKFDKDGGAERIVFDMQQNGNYEIDKTVEKCIEVEVSTQTDPLPDDFVCEEFEITDDMKIIEPRRSKTLEDILKEEQEAEIERARQLAEEENLTKSIQKFREAGQRSYSERSRGSTGEAERSRTHSRPSTPAIVIEKRVPTPIPNKINETMLAASLIVQPVDNYDVDEELAREMVRSEEQQLEEQVAMSDISSQKQEEEERLTVDYSSDQRSVISDAKTLDRETEKPSSYEGSLREEQITTEDERYSLEDGDKKIESEFEEPPPQPPPRKRSSVPTVDTIDSSNAALSTRDQQLESESALTVHSERAVESSPSTKLAIADLEVERLSVHALQAGRIMVSELQGSQISADELECKSGNLVVQNLQFPPGFIEQIIERVRSTEREQHSQAQTQTTEEKDEKAAPTTQQQDEAPARPPVPQQPPVFTSEDLQYSIPPPSFYQLRNPTEEEHPQHYPVQRRRRHHRRRDSSSADDEYSRERRRSSRQETRSPEPSIGQLSGQLLRLCGSNVMRTMNQIVNYLQTAQKEGTERNISTAMVLLVLMAFGFLMLGLSGKNIHHHHWDFFNPPGNEGRDQ